MQVSATSQEEAARSAAPAGHPAGPVETQPQATQGQQTDSEADGAASAAQHQTAPPTAATSPVAPPAAGSKASASGGKTTGSRRPLIIAASSIAVLGLIVLVGTRLLGGGATLTLDGFPIASPEEALSAAAESYRRTLLQGGEEEVAPPSISEAFTCHFVSGSVDMEGSVPVQQSVACGPVIHLGGSVENAWDRVPLEYDMVDGVALLSIPADGLSAESLGQIPTGQLLDGAGREISPEVDISPPPIPQLPASSVTVADFYASDELAGDPSLDCELVGVVGWGSICLRPTKLADSAGKGVAARAAAAGQKVAVLDIFCRRSGPSALRITFPENGDEGPNETIDCGDGSSALSVLASTSAQTAVLSPLSAGGEDVTINFDTGAMAGSDPFWSIVGAAAVTSGLQGEFDNYSAISTSVSGEVTARDPDDGNLLYTAQTPQAALAASPLAVSDLAKSCADGPCLGLFWKLGERNNFLAPAPCVDFRKSDVKVSLNGEPTKNFEVYRRDSNRYGIIMSEVEPAQRMNLSAQWNPTGTLRDYCADQKLTDFSGLISVTADFNLSELD